ncbi:UvrD-helicase domain-containing protein [Bacillus taeanensis]|uniref:DNA 3'-5' helicase n=1 Tax=Bacillus taeanensis TaxID=273032 RepID=A0A366Y1X4_9BACI|nr:UvrD-helicase domain-containing protein [Bacillus taeanensis]RBW71385.1 DNA helicase UvrD [Bacillus taeanensis]
MKFVETPYGVKTKKRPIASLTAAEAVLDYTTEADKAFFTSLHQHGIILNQQQMEAVTHVEGPLLTIAGAGSGKTAVLTARTAYLLTVKKIDPKHILLVTFTRKAANEMRERLLKFSGMTQEIIQSLSVGTFHSFFLSMLRKLGINHTILSNDRYRHMMIELIIRDLGIKGDYQPEAVLAAISHYKMNMIYADDAPSETNVEQEIKKIYQQYEAQKKAKKQIDFDDILLASYTLLNMQPSLLASVQKRFHYIMVDEFQDTNQLQYELIKKIALPDNHLFVVGDDDQVIYTFNGADSNIILDFPTHYPRAKKITLSTNYRCTDTILGLSNAVIDHNKKRFPKKLTAAKKGNFHPKFARPKTTEDEANTIIDKIITDVENGEKTYRDFAILSRTHTNARAMFEQLVIREVPFIAHTIKQIFYEQAVIKPVIAHLRLSLEPQNLTAISSILPALYINKEKAIHFIEMEDFVDPKEEPLLHLLNEKNLKEFQKKKISERALLIRSLAGMTPEQAIRKVRKDYEKYLETDGRQTLTMHKDTIKESLDELEFSSKRFETIAAFLSFIDSLRNKYEQLAKANEHTLSNAVSLMSIHQAKGLEFPAVFFIGASETIIPHGFSLSADEKSDLIYEKGKGKQKVAAAIEEERRLCYVAMTRAINELYVSSPCEYRGKTIGVSRFILEAFQTKPVISKQENLNEVPILSCTNQHCNGWMKITSNHHSIQERACPICGEKMVESIKNVKV